VAVLVTGVGISAVAQDAADAKKQELQRLRDRARQIDGQIGGMATFYYTRRGRCGTGQDEGSGRSGV
jgi:hypothetical protein